MTVSFGGRLVDGTKLYVDFNNPAWLNLSNMNAGAFLCGLGLYTDRELYGEASIVEVRRAIIRVRNTRTASAYTREREMGDGANNQGCPARPPCPRSVRG